MKKRKNPLDNGDHMIKRLSIKSTSGRMVGWVGYQPFRDSKENVGSIFLGEDGTFELSISCIPKSGVLDLHFNDPVFNDDIPLLMFKNCIHCDLETVIGNVSLNGESGEAVFSAFPIMDSRYIFRL